LSIRPPAVAGSWYSGSAEGLRSEIKECFLSKHGPGKLPKAIEKGQRKIVALVCPHAGYMYSGPIATHAYYTLALDGKPDLFVILGPNHTGMGSGVSIMVRGAWRTPLGTVPIDNELAAMIQHAAKILDIDDSAHLYEHSIELQLPFLQYVYGGTFKFVPICMMIQDLETSREIGQAIGKVVAGKNVVVIASSDMTHGNMPPILTHEEVKKRDEKALAEILKMDEAKLQAAVEKYNVTMCGFGPVVAALTAAKVLKAKKAQLLSYKTTGDITGDRYGVVGYASIAITK